MDEELSVKKAERVQIKWPWKFGFLRGEFSVPLSLAVSLRQLGSMRYCN